MKTIARFLPLILCATLTLAFNFPLQADDIGSSIRIAHCRSICLMNHIIDDIKCTNITISYHCHRCWKECYLLGIAREEDRHVRCRKLDKMHKRMPRYPGLHTACVFYETRGEEKDKYEPSKLPAPEKCKTIHMKDHDVAVMMRKDKIWDIWSSDNYYSANEISTLPEGAWIIVASEDGTLRHYSWEMWKPTLELLEKGDPLYQAHITWKDWRAQLKQQLEKAPELESEYYPGKEKFVVTWQYETGDGIMGNQVTNSESAHISLPSNSKYLVRITTNDSPGSYPIVVDTRCRFKNFLWQPIEYFYSIRWLIFFAFPVIIILFLILIYLHRFLLHQFKANIKLKANLKKTSLSNKSNKAIILLEEGHLMTTKKNNQKQCDSHISQVHQSISETITNKNLQTAITKSQETKANSADINAKL